MLTSLRLNRCEPDRVAIESVLPDLHRQIIVLDAAVKETGYLAGNQFSFADINLMPILHRLSLTPEGKDALAGAPSLSMYYEQHAKRASFQRTCPPEGPPVRSN
ncbi:glutathione S-transferase C-terminal domain-containing protein [Bradyrhizobium genomosp. III]|uniref:glutathione S-transferase family protein n=1 Tax=Bradyrhizobium genomosp. III TaxID=2683271 RepID=UPI0009D9E3DF